MAEVGEKAKLELFTGEYQQKSAEEKMSLLWQEITKSSIPAAFLPKNSMEAVTRISVLATEDMNVSFDSCSDVMPRKGALCGLKKRVKIIHTSGYIGRASFVPKGNHPYTGIFKSGAKNTIIRLSDDILHDKSQRGLVPGLSLKFLRDGVPSANTFGMVSIEGIEGFNFFDRDLHTHMCVISKTATEVVHLGQKIFESASKWISMAGISNLALYDERGNLSQEPRAPFELVFQPTKQIREAFKDASDLHLGYLKDVPLGTFFNVFAVENPRSAPVLIGTLDLLTQLSTSNFGDKKLFFQHQRMEDDFKLRPDWIPAADEIRKEQASKDYPNLPDNLPYIE